MKFSLNPQVHDINVFGYMHQRCHALPLWEDQCVPIDVVMPSTHAANGGGRGGYRGWEERQMGGAH